ncbi:uncharacterized protein [Anolis sagrei]|uniref:uncharacterized protein isoform X2 n=1 Tax=Anolis sagrei TaxID=38937 RepID=UPI00351FDFD9
MGFSAPANGHSQFEKGGPQPEICSHPLPVMHKNPQRPRIIPLFLLDLFTGENQPYVENMPLQDVFENVEIPAVEVPDLQVMEQMFSDDSVDEPPKVTTTSSVNTGKGLKRNRSETQKPAKPCEMQKGNDVADNHVQPKKMNLIECLTELRRLTYEVSDCYKHYKAFKERHDQIIDRDIPNIYKEILARMNLTNSEHDQMGGGLHQRGRGMCKKPAPGDLYWKRRLKLIKKARQTLARSKK